MTELNFHPLEAILTWCAEAAPNPWYPSTFAQTAGIPREKLDPFLDELRLGGLIRLTDWVPGRGQGYTLTEEGAEVVRNPRLMERVKTQGVPRLPTPRPAPDRLEGRETSFDRGEKVRSVLLNPVRPRVTRALILVNVMVFLAGLGIAVQDGKPLNDFVMKSDSRVLLLTGAVNPQQVWAGEWWRLVTSCFVHIGLLHLLANMYALYILGPSVESLFGHWRYLLLYLVAGFGGSCIGELAQPATLAGASGAICGLLGAILMWTLLNRQYLPPPLASRWLRAVSINTVLIVFISMIPGVSWAGHLGGGVVGLLAAGLLTRHRFGTGMLRWLALIGLLLLPLGCYALLMRAPSLNPEWIPVVQASEIQEINEDYLPRLAPLNKAIRLTEVRARRLVEESPARRDREEVRAVIGALGQVRNQIPEMVAMLRRAGPYLGRRSENARQILIEILEGRARLFGLYQRCLEQGKKWTDRESEDLQVQRAKVDAAEARWLKLAHDAD